VLAFQAATALIVGGALFFVPEQSALLWHWALTPLTARAVGAWFVGLGVTGGQTLWENDGSRVTGSLLAYAAFGGLQLVALARYAGDVDWSKLTAWLYLLSMVSVLLLGVYAWRSATRPRSATRLHSA